LNERQREIMQHQRERVGGSGRKQGEKTQKDDVFKVGGGGRAVRWERLGITPTCKSRKAEPRLTFNGEKHKGRGDSWLTG